MKIRALRQLSLLLALSLLLLTYTPSAAGAQRSPGTAPRSVGASAGSAGTNGVLFVENAGQWDAGARYQAWGGSAGTLWLAEDALWLTLVERPADDGVDEGANLSRHFDALRAGAASKGVTGTVANVRLTFPGANPHPRLEPYARVDTTVSYFLGNDPAGWRAAVPVWAGVRYVDLYPGIDLEVGGDGGQVTPRLVARPGTDLGRVSLRVEGAEAVSVGDGRLQVSTAAGDLAFPLLAVDGVLDGQAPHVAAAGGVFDVAAPLTAEGTGALTGQTAAGRGVQAATGDSADLIYGTFLGGGSQDRGERVAVDVAGRAYVTGYTYSGDFPTTIGAFDIDYSGGNYTADAFVVQLNPAGSALEYATFLGGSRWDSGKGIVVDAAGRAYVTGVTGSSDFPTTIGAFDTSCDDAYNDAYVVRLNPMGSVLEYATFLGGDSDDWGEGIAVDATGRVYIAGVTKSSDFPTTPGAFDTSYNGGSSDAYVARLNQAGSGLEYATYLGGTGTDKEAGIAVDVAGQAYVTGSTSSSDFPTTLGAFDTSINGDDDVFVVRLNPAGSVLGYATFLGGSARESGEGIAVDETGRAYVAGTTWSNNFPTTAGAFDTSYNGGYNDAYVARLNQAGSALEYATFLGGSDYDEGMAIAVVTGGWAYVTGHTYSIDFPTTLGVFDTSHNGGYYDVFVVRLNAAGGGLEYASYLGGGDWDYGADIAVDAAGWAYVTGYTFSKGFPTTPGAFDTTFNGGTIDHDVYLAQLAIEIEHLYLPALFR